MITLNDVLIIHENSIRDFGGSHGVRDQQMLESAVARPFQSFGGEEFYPTPFEKAAAIMQSIICNHPFIDGNKRTGFLAGFHLLYIYGFEITENHENEAYDFVIAIASSQTSFEDITAWLQTHTVQLY